jgi:hypothetical protein
MHGFLMSISRTREDGRAAARDAGARLRAELDLYRRLLELGSREALDPFLKEALALVVELTGARQGYLELRDAVAAEPDGVWSLSVGFSEPELEHLQAASRGASSAKLARARPC